ncbi:sigma-70 family RNA polymerase sigma factor, partial [Acaryochloris marina NIES-2412]|uniref:sigma-70 family RNA polymerase sigma factor n=1 Tax=Acaryochloris marina TaxID=155978 RepID=UPI00405878DB
MAKLRLLVQEGLKIAPSVRREISRHPPLGNEIEQRLLLAAQSGDITARQKLINHNLAYVAKVGGAYRTEQPGALVDDNVLFNQGIIGLNKAIDKWSPDGGANLRTFAYWHIRKAMQSDDGLYATETIRLPESTRRQIKELNQAMEVGAITPEEIAEHTGFEVKRINFLSSAHQPSSLNNVAITDEQTEWIDLLPDPHEPSGIQELEESLPFGCSELDLNQLLEQISPIFAKAIRLRFLQGLTYKALAERLSVTLGKGKKILTAGLAALKALLLQPLTSEPVAQVEDPSLETEEATPPSGLAAFILRRLRHQVLSRGVQLIPSVNRVIIASSNRLGLQSPPSSYLIDYEVSNNIVSFKPGQLKDLVCPDFYSQKEFDSGGFAVIR